ncbi:HDIG domain-containing metalloprotein [Roseisolibacter sp. H3M3-2]|uniref:HD family phosphohydrolase n=1 Tax=Roseisolibacter sp. H3M3-2 TaxID=3031323 RepID=UPI0023DBAEFB|nr:HDIG domain-containing metalloprotein [Roseisolibacter sp. H3M3-2]MDF1502169.1 HDIG domain-containing protein [Roseisolibacter sp. H3M3-2]
MGLWGQPEPSDGEGSRRALVRAHGGRLLLAVALAVVTYLLFPTAPAADAPLYEVGSVAPENVIAPFAFRVPKTADELRAERERVVRESPPVLGYEPSAVDSARAHVRRFGALLEAALGENGGAAAANAVVVQAAGAGVRITPAELAYLRAQPRRRVLLAAVERTLDGALPGGVASSTALGDVRGDVAVGREGGLRVVPTDSVPTLATLLGQARRSQPDPGSEVAEALYVKLLSAFFRASLVPDRAATERRRAEAVAAIDPNRWLVRAGEKIVGAHEVVGREEFDKMRALQSAVADRGMAERSVARGATRVAGALLHNLVLIGVFGVTLLLFRPSLYGSMRVMGLFAVGFVLVLGAAAFVARMPNPRPELIPVALAAVLFSVLFDARISLVAVLLLAILVGSQGPFRGSNALFVVLLGGVAAAAGVRTLRRRTQAYSAMLVVALGYVLSAATLALALGWNLREFGVTAGLGALNAAVSVALALGLLAPAEEFTGIDTYLRLLEWSDLNRPVLQRLSLEAPGTYAHTIAMANLAEAACNAIGANGLLARVGTYYHDIGKLERPNYFVENQAKGRNPHDKLKPSASAAIIRNHVREGLELAEEIKLPKVLRAFITEHHGTGRIVYFYEKAKERGDATSPNAVEYSYPGPTPQSAETAIVMLADGVEASARALSEPTPQKLRELVEHVVRMRIEQGQLRDAPLTLRQLEIAKDQFVRVLLGMHHARIEYPAASGGVTAEFASA